MAKGGARARSGPPPNPASLNSAKTIGEWVVLPAEGREGPAPEWPLMGVTAREVELWESLWRKPQAVEWERLGQEYEVALYVRRLSEAEMPGSLVTLSTLVRQMADSLGLTTPGMRAARWRIAPSEERTQQVKAAQPLRPSSRSRLKVVDGDGES